MWLVISLSPKNLENFSRPSKRSCYGWGLTSDLLSQIHFEQNLEEESSKRHRQDHLDDLIQLFMMFNEPTLGLLTHLVQPAVVVL